VQPDISINICDREKLGSEGCRGVPDFVAEILSSSNTAIDMERKFRLYLDAGVKEYWVVDPEHKTLNAYSFADGAIQTQTHSYSATDKARIGIFRDFAVDLEPVFAG